MADDSDFSLEILSHFLAPRRADEIETSFRWNAMTGNAPGRIIEALTASGLLAEASLVQAIEATFAVPELRELLKIRKLKSSGRKAELAQRLAEAAPETLEDVKRATAGRVLVCSDRGREVATAHRARQADARRAAEDASIAALRAGAFEEAVRIVADFKAALLFPEGLGVDWNSASHRAAMRAEVSQIFAIAPGSPHILADLPAEHFVSLQIAAAWMALWGSPTGRREDLPPAPAPGRFLDWAAAARSILKFVRGRTDLARFRSIRAEFVEVMTSSDSCEACAALASRRFPIADAPELPHVGCSDPRGCRCAYGFVPPDFLERP